MIASNTANATIKIITANDDSGMSIYKINIIHKKTVHFTERSFYTPLKTCILFY